MNIKRYGVPLLPSSVLVEYLVYEYMSISLPIKVTDCDYYMVCNQSILIFNLWIRQ
jgi:hypothetical protein